MKLKRLCHRHYVFNIVWPSVYVLQMKMTEIYDVTDADSEAVQSPAERDLNKQLEFDNDWSGDLIADEEGTTWKHSTFIISLSLLLTPARPAV